eukprot:75233-Chlamydomonas_euryale.AAC.1
MNPSPSPPLPCRPAPRPWRPCPQVRFALDRNSDFAMVGGRCDALAHYDVGFSDDGKILALDMRVYCMAGPWLELSFTELFGLTFHPDSVYDIPALRLQVCQHANLLGGGGEVAQ